MDLLEWVVLVIGGVAAGAVNTMAGGGTLLTFPLLVLIGLTPDVANGTNRIAVLVQSVVASATFQKKGFGGIGLGLKLLPGGLVGAAVGTLIATQVDPDLYRRIFGLTMLPIASIVFLRRKRGFATSGTPEQSLGALMAVFFFVGLYAGFIQVGVGLLALTALVSLGGLDLSHGNAVKVFTIAAFAVISVAIFTWAGDVSWSHGIGLSVATGLGGYIGSIATIKRGDRWIRHIFLIAAIGLAARMIFG